MSLRWKTREPENPYLPADSTLAEMNRNSMEGYRPNSAMAPDGTGMNGYFNAQAAAPQGYRPNVADPQGVRGQQPVDMEGYGASMQAASNRAGIQARITELETELASVTNKIAEIDKATPGLSKNPKEWEIAAKRAEVGDMSAYDNLVSRGNADSAAASGIENELLNAEKLTWGLKSNDTETRRAARKQGEIAIIRAEEWAAKTGKDLPSSYYRLKNALAAPEEGPNANTIVGMLWSKMQDKSLNDADRAYAKALHDADPNSADAPKLREIYENTKGKTIESKEEYNKKVKASNALYDQAKDLPKKGLVKWWEGLSEQDRKLFKLKHTIDLVKGVVQ